MNPRDKIQMYRRLLRTAQNELRSAEAELRTAAGERTFYVHTFYLTDTVTEVHADSEAEAIERAWNNEGNVLDELHTTGLPEDQTYLVEEAVPTQSGGKSYTPVQRLTGTPAVELVIRPEHLKKRR